MKQYISIFEAAGGVKYHEIDWDQSDTDFTNKRVSTSHIDGDSIAFGIHPDTGEMLISPLSQTHAYMFEVKHDHLVKLKDIDWRSESKYAGRIWLKEKLISFYGKPSSDAVKEVADAMQVTCKKFSEAYDLSIKGNTLQKFFNPDEILYPKLLDKWYMLTRMYKDDIKEIGETGLYDHFIETYDTEDMDNGGYKVINQRIIKIRDYINGEEQPVVATEEELNTPHTLSPLEKQKRVVPANFGSRKKRSGVPIGENNQYIPIFENPDYITSLGLDVGNADALPFIVTKNEVLFGEFGGTHLNSINNTKTSMVDSYGGRLWIKSKVMSFWTNPSPDTMEAFIPRFNYDIAKFLKSQALTHIVDIWDYDIEIDNVYATTQKILNDYLDEFNDYLEIDRQQNSVDAGNYSESELNKLVSSFIESKSYSANTEIYDSRVYEIIPVKEYVKLNDTPNNPSTAEYEEHIKSPMEKEKKAVPKNMGSNKPKPIRIGESIDTEEVEVEKAQQQPQPEKHNTESDISKEVLDVQQDVTETENFKKWFGNSKIVDKEGKPLVCYHGTNSGEFSEFKSSTIGSAHDRGFYGDGYYFTFNDWHPKLSKGEAGYYGNTVMEVYIKAENPFYFNKLSEYKGNETHAMFYEPLVFLRNIAELFPEIADKITLQKKGKYNPEDDSYPLTDVPISVLPALFEKYDKLVKIEDVYDGDKPSVKIAHVKSTKESFVGKDGKTHEWINTEDLGRYSLETPEWEVRLFAIIDAIEKYDGIEADLHPEGYMTRNPEITEMIRKRGHDSIVQTPHGDEVVVFKANQIKSATGNSGKFDSNSNNINESVFESYIPTYEDVETDTEEVEVEKAQQQPQPKKHNTESDISKEVLDVQQDVTETENFNKWFGDSKVVDGAGKPLVVYHGSPNGAISVFDNSKSKNISSGLREEGFMFTSNKKLAEQYSKGRKLDPEFVKDRKQEIYKLEQLKYEVRTNRDYEQLSNQIKSIEDELNGKEYEVYLKMENPFIFDAKGLDGYNGWRELKIDVGYKTAIGIDAIDAVKGNNSMFKSSHDGIIAKNMVDIHLNGHEMRREDRQLLGDVYLVFNANQIKSATGNSGEFDSNSDNINETNFQSYVPTYESTNSTSLDWEKGISERGNLKEPISDGDDIYVFRAASKAEVDNILNNNGDSGSFWGSKLEYHGDYYMVAKSSKTGISMAWNIKREPDNIKAIVTDGGFKDIRTPNPKFERNYNLNLDHFQQVGTKYNKSEILAIYDANGKLIYNENQLNESISQSKVEEMKVIPNWSNHVNSIPMLKEGVDILNRIVEIATKNNIDNPEAYIVGGAVRDLLTGEKEPDDIDIATNVPVDVLEPHFKTKDIGKNKDFNLIMAISNGFEFEIANYRADVYSQEAIESGKGADSVQDVETYQEDSSRRDFTVNAMGVDKDGNIIDYHGGMEDIETKTIRAVGDPKQRFEEDATRLLRAIRFSNRLGFTIDEKTLEEIKNSAPLIKKIVSERVMKEVRKLAKQPGPKFAEALNSLYDTGLLQEIFPEIAKMKGYEHNDEHHPEGGVWEHVMAAIAANKEADPLVNLGILLHDVGKPETYEHTQEKGHTYHSHESVGEEMIEAMAKRLDLSNDEKDAIKFVTKKHMLVHNLDKLNKKNLISLVNDPNWGLLKKVAKADAMSRGMLYSEEDWTKIEEIQKEVNEKFPPGHMEQVDIIKQIKNQYVGGKLVMRLLGLKRGGPIIGDIQEIVADWIIETEIKDQDEINKKILETYKDLTGQEIVNEGTTQNIPINEGFVLTELEDKYGIDLELWDKGDYLILSKIIVPKNERGGGIGVRAMEEIIDYADSENKPIYLTPSTDFGATSKSRLERFYKRFGFKKNRDSSSTWEAMVREPINEGFNQFIPISESMKDTPDYKEYFKFSK